MRKNFKLTLVALSLLALTACSAEHEPTVGKYPILFGYSDTRAVADLDDLQGNGFRVYAFVDGVNDISFTKDVYWVENDEVWAYDKLEYWVPGCNYSFRAFYPNPEDNYTLNVDTTSADLSYTINNFDITSQQDLMQASATAKVAQGDAAPVGGSVVSLQFKHLLANVVVKIKAEVNVTINNVSLKYVPVKGSYADGSWSYSSQGNIEKDGLNKSLSSSSNEYHDVTDGGFLAFPCDINETKLYIKTSDKTYELPLTAPTSWVAGNRYTYTLTIKQDNILFDEPTVEEWDEENAVGSVIIK